MVRNHSQRKIFFIFPVPWCRQKTRIRSRSKENATRITSSTMCNTRSPRLSTIERNIRNSQRTTQIRMHRRRWQSLFVGMWKCGWHIDQVWGFVVFEYQSVQEFNSSIFWIIFFLEPKKKLVKIIWRTWRFQTILLINWKKWTRIWLKNK